jgi:secondary thiamine-phosphate synthase enzyme
MSGKKPVQPVLITEELEAPAPPPQPKKPEPEAVKSIPVSTSSHNQFVDITARVADAVKESGVASGVCTVFVPHTTAGVTINENADPDVVRDIISTLERLVPHIGAYRHAEGNSDAHVKASMMGSSVTVIVEGGRLVLGTWQGIYFCEFDGPRNRKIYIKVS